MPYNIVGDRITFTFGVVCAVLSVFCIKKEPRRISCGILMVMALYCTITGGLRLFAPNLTFDNGAMAIGRGEETLLFIMYALIAISFVGGIALLVNGVGVTRREGFSLAHALPLFFGLMGLAWPIMYFMFLILPDWIMPLYNAVWGIFLYVPGMLAAVLLLSFVYAALPKPKHADFIVVLGAGLKDDGTVSPLLAKRVDRAIKLYMDEGKTASFVVSGGKGTDEVNSEAFAMRLYLLEHGIDDSQIIMEDQSVNTQENIRFSKKLILERKQDYRAAVVTSNYHVLRAVILAKNERMNAYGIGGKTALYYLPAAFIREYIAVIFNYKKLAIFYVTAVLIIAILEILF